MASSINYSKEYIVSVLLYHHCCCYPYRSFGCLLQFNVALMSLDLSELRRKRKLGNKRAQKSILCAKTLTSA